MTYQGEIETLVARAELSKRIDEMLSWEDLGGGRKLHAVIGVFAAEVSQSSDGRWFAEIGIADKRDPYWMIVVLDSIRRWNESVATADDAKWWVVDALVSLMFPRTKVTR